MAHNVVTTDRTITLTVDDGSANIIDTSGGSYTEATIAANTQFVRLPVNTVEQSGTISNVSITATLDSSTTDLDASNASASISVFDKDVPTLSIVESSVRATEGQPFEITIMADPAPVENLTINLTSSAPSGNPFTFSPNPIVMSASSTSTKVVVTAEDVSDDITHRIRIEESIRYNSSLTDLLSVLILDNDNPIATRPNVSISEVAASVAEGSPALFTISLDPATISRIVTDGSGPPTIEMIPNTAIVSLNISDENSALGTGVQTTQDITVRGTGTFEVPTRRS